MRKTILALLTFLIINNLLAQYNDNDIGVVIASNVNVRDETSISGEILKKAQKWEYAVILKQSDEEFHYDENNEFFYNWYYVKFQDGIKGWIYGQYLFRGQYYDKSKYISINGTIYELRLFREMAMSNDPPEGDSYTIPLFYNKNNKEFIPIYCYNQDVLDKLMERDPLPGNCFRLIENTSCDESVGLKNSYKNIVNTSTFKIDYSIGYQEGGANGELVLKYNNKKIYLIDVVNLKEIDLYHSE